MPHSYKYIALGSFVAYLVGFIVLYRLTGFGSSIIAVVPVIVIAWLYGCLPGIGVGLLAAPVNIMMYVILGEDWFEKGILGGTIVVGTMAVTFIGAIVGRLRDVSLKLRSVNLELQDEVQERMRAEEELLMHRDNLDELVKLRTGELQRANQQLVSSEHQLRESMEFIENVFETTGDGIFVTDAEGKIARANRTFYDMIGYSEEELVGKHVRELSVSPALQDDVHPVPERLFAEGNIKGFETQQVRKNKIIYPVELNISVLRDAQGKLIGSVCSVRDISARKAMEAQAKRQQQQLLQADKMASLGTLVAGVAHEINNPINLILMQNRLNRRVWQDIKPELVKLAEGNPRKKYGGLTLNYITGHFDRLFADVDSAAGRVETIVRQLKDFSRKTDLEEKKPVDVNQALANAVSLIKTTAGKAGVILGISSGEALPPIEGNLQNIEQVFVNIIINAIEAIDHENGKIVIATYYDPGMGTVAATVSDNGRGIPSQHKEKIFDPFFTTRQAEGGTGLGLSICYNIIKQHHGTITVDKSPDGGASFTVRLPAHTDSGPDATRS